MKDSNQKFESIAMLELKRIIKMDLLFGPGKNLSLRNLNNIVGSKNQNHLKVKSPPKIFTIRI